MLSSKTQTEVEALVASTSFKNWWSEWQAVITMLALERNAFEKNDSECAIARFETERLHEIALRKINESNGLSDEIESLEHQAAEIDNAVFEQVSEFEKQRLRTTEHWQQMQAAEAELLEVDEGGTPRLQKDFERKEAAYQGENKIKSTLWERVEKSLQQYAGIRFEISDIKERRARIRYEAELDFEEFESKQKRLKSLEEERQATKSRVEEQLAILSELQNRVAEAFECTAGRDFLFWRDKDTDRGAFVLSLIESNAAHFGCEVKSMTLYKTSVDDGLDNLIPI